MTRPLQSGSRLRPSRICRFLLCAVIFKICLVGAIIVDPFGPDGFKLPFFYTEIITGKTASATAQAPSARVLLASPAAHAAQPESAATAKPPPQSNISREATQRRQEELARKEQDLKTLEKDLDDRLLRLQDLEVRLQTMLKEAEEVENAKFRHLVDVFSNMKAKQAAGVLETLDEKIAVKVLAGMRGRQAGEILTFINPIKAARLSESLTRVQLPFE